MRAIGTLHEPGTGRRWGPRTIEREVACRTERHRRLGLGPGERCLIAFGNRLEFFAELLAVWRTGACAVPIDPRLSAREIAALVHSARPRLAIVDARASSPGCADGLDGVTVRDTLDADDRVTEGRLPGACLDDEALILFTSGSTGTPKGVVHTHRSLLARWSALRSSLGTESFERTLCALPTHFGHGLICNSLFPWLAGRDLYVVPPFDTGFLTRLGAFVDEHAITFLSSVPSLWNLALRVGAPPERGSLRRVHIGSAPLSGALWEEVRRWSGTREVANVYGITETGSWVAGTLGETAPADGLIGVGWGTEIRIDAARSVDELTDSSGSPAGEEGMIWLRTPGLMRAYHELPERTAATIRDGWFLTGDIGVVDERGLLHVRGRERDEINKGGTKIFPSDIDLVVNEDPAVLDACAFGYADPLYGENVALALVLEEPTPRTATAVHERLADEIAAHKLPLRWYLVDEIPRTGRGKLNRASVAARCAEMTPIALGRSSATEDGAR